MSFDYHHPAYRQARADAFSRAGGLCQNCGSHEATHAVHVALEYPPAAETQPGDLTAMCNTCQQMNRDMRAYLKAGGSIYELAGALAVAIRQAVPGVGVPSAMLRGGQPQPSVMTGLPKKPRRRTPAELVRQAIEAPAKTGG